MKSANYLSACALALVIPALGHAATVSGTVKSPNGTPYRGAFVQAQNSATRVMVSVLTDKAGRYRIENLPAGQYQLQLRAPGFIADPKPGLTISANENASYEFALKNDVVHWADLS